MQSSWQDFPCKKSQSQQKLYNLSQIFKLGTLQQFILSRFTYQNICTSCLCFSIRICLVMCLGCSCNRKVWAVGFDHNRSPMGLWGCNKGVRDCLYVCAQRAKEWEAWCEHGCKRACRSALCDRGVGNDRAKWVKECWIKLYTAW